MLKWFKRNKQTSTEHYRGREGCKYGIYDPLTQKFLFDIAEDSPALALSRLFYKIGYDGAAKLKTFEINPIDESSVHRADN